MATDTNVPRSRRALLLSAAGAAAATALAAAGRPPAAMAADGDPLLLGEANEAASSTSVNAQGSAFLVHATYGRAVSGFSDGDVS